MPMPDAQIHPVATGNAIKIVEAHQEPQELVFYSGELISGDEGKALKLTSW